MCRVSTNRAQVAHGLNFEQLSAAEQKEILRRYRVGGVLLDETPDERQEAARLQANDAVFRFLRITLLWFAAGYWAVWLWMPAGRWRDMLTDSPVIISWLVVFVISLPQAMRCVLLAAFVVSVIRIVTSQGTPFLYFQF